MRRKKTQQQQPETRHNVSLNRRAATTQAALVEYNTAFPLRMRRPSRDGTWPVTEPTSTSVVPERKEQISQHGDGVNDSALHCADMLNGAPSTIPRIPICADMLNGAHLTNMSMLSLFHSHIVRYTTENTHKISHPYTRVHNANTVTTTGNTMLTRTPPRRN